MTLQALAAFLISWVLPTSPPPPTIGSDGVPRWEKTPGEQRHLRDQDRSEASRWLRLPRGY